jgi:microcin C transport system ATP-binding protein
VKGVSASRWAGETVALVGESGSGKSVTALSTVGFWATNAEACGVDHAIEGGDGRRARGRAARQVRGNDISFIFQEPMTSLNPLHTMEKQIGESAGCCIRA